VKTNKVIKDKVKYEEGQTLNFNLIGSYSKIEITDGMKLDNQNLFKKYEDHLVFEYDLPRSIAKHLVKEYGTVAKRVAELGKQTGTNKQLTSDSDKPFLEAEVLFAIREQMAQKPNDVLCRRVPISFLDQEVAQTQVLSKVIDIFAKEKKWDAKKKAQELSEAEAGLKSMK
jgi:glycerol-3-phosphate dehydrogenase